MRRRQNVEKKILTFFKINKHESYSCVAYLVDFPRLPPKMCALSFRLFISINKYKSILLRNTLKRARQCDEMI